MVRTVISKPDEHTHIYEAKEKVILKAIARVLKEKNIGSNVIIDEKNHRVDSDYVVSDDWRTKTTALCEKAQLEGMRSEPRCDDGKENKKWLGNAPPVTKKSNMIIFSV